MAEQIAYLPCPIISKEIKDEIQALGYIAVDDDFAPDGYQLPPELQSIKQRIDDENAAIVAQAKQFNDALDALADSKRPASKQWVKDYVSEHGGGGSVPPDYNKIKDQVAKNTADIQKLADYLGVDLNIEYIPLQDNQGVVMPDGVGLDTGLTLNGNATFRVTGCLKNKDNQVCLIGARTGTSKSERTCINMLPVSGQIQSQWAANNYKTENIEMTQPFEIVADKTQTTITQAGGVYIVIENAGFNGTNAETPICLLNQSLSNEQYYSPVLQRAEIEINGVKTVFEPKIKRNIETGAESLVMLKNGVDMNISGLTLFEIQAA